MRAFFFFSNDEGDGAVGGNLFDVVRVDFVVEFKIKDILVLFRTWTR
jgi:hypothetical protein